MIHENPDLFVIYDGDPGLEFQSECYGFPGILDGIYRADDADDWSLDQEDREALLTWLETRDLDEVEVRTSVWGWLSADGYLDATDPVLGETVSEVAQQLLDLYYDKDPESLTEDERQEIAWLKEEIRNR